MEFSLRGRDELHVFRFVIYLTMKPACHLLLISNSTLHGRGYLDHVEEEIRNILGSARRVLFFPYALHDRDGGESDGAIRGDGLRAGLTARLIRGKLPTRRRFSRWRQHVPT